MIRFEGKIKENIGRLPHDHVQIEGEINGKRCRIVIEADGIADELQGLCRGNLEG